MKLNRILGYCTLVVGVERREYQSASIIEYEPGLSTAAGQGGNELCYRTSWLFAGLEGYGAEFGLITIGTS